MVVSECAATQLSPHTRPHDALERSGGAAGEGDQHDFGWLSKVPRFSRPGNAAITLRAEAQL